MLRQMRRPRQSNREPVIAFVGFSVMTETPSMVAAFFAGILSFLSPCVLPLVPGYLSMMSGVGATQMAVQTRADQRTLLRATLLFVAGFTLVFVALGATASAVANVLSEHQRGLNQIAGVVIIVMGLFLAGLMS